MGTKDTDPDPKGERGGDTGNTKQLGKGPQAEKGDQRREEMDTDSRSHSRPGSQSGEQNRSGSQSDES